METLKILAITPNNAEEQTLFCVQDIKSPGFKSKYAWFEKQYNKGLRLKILKNEVGKMIGFIEYVPAAEAWRPIHADNFMFIHCMYVYSKKDRQKGYGSMLINDAVKDAKAKKMDGVCVMTSKGAWMATKDIFEKNEFKQVDKRDRFELLSKKWNNSVADPKLIDWTSNQKKYKGWHLLYADQCPWHEKSAVALLNAAYDHNIDLKITKIETAEEAKKAPSGFAVFNLLHDGKLIEDHYLSETRFRNILKKELQL